MCAYINVQIIHIANICNSCKNSVATDEARSLKLALSEGGSRGNIES